MNELEKMIRDRLSWNNDVDESQIEISVKEDIATLKGCVSNYLEKLLAEIETQMIPEIKFVVNNIEVKFNDSDLGLSDENLKEAMFCLLDANSEINSDDILVLIDNGNLTLNGKVNSYWKREKIQNLASQIKGIKSIVNKISVVPDVEIGDEEIGRLIMTALRNSVHVDAHKVNVSVNEGIVSLAGTLSSKSEHDTVKNIVISTKGVVNIINNLKWVLRYDTT